MPQHYAYASVDPLDSQSEYRGHVMLATPTTRALVPSYNIGLVGSIETLVRFGVRFTYRIYEGDCHVDDARNILIREFLKSDCTDLFFLDSDLGWRAQDLLHLLEVPGDIVAGVYRHKNDNETYPFHPGDGEREANEFGLFAMPKLATGFMRIRRPVLEALYNYEKERGRTSWGKAEDPAVDMPWARIVERAFVKELPFQLEGELPHSYHSGDYVLCLKARHLGFSCYVDVEMPFEHVGEKTWFGHAGNFFRRSQNIPTQAFERAMGQLLGRDLSALPILVENSDHPPFVMPANALERLYKLCEGRAQLKALETGTGLSTLVMAAAMRFTGGHVFSLEHDLLYLQKIEQLLNRFDLQSHVTLMYAPLYPMEGEGSGNWYGCAGAELPCGKVDIFLNDGPPRTRGNRLYAYKALVENIVMARHWIIDDCDRTTDEAVIRELAGARTLDWLDGTSGKAHHTVCFAEFLKV